MAAGSCIEPSQFVLSTCFAFILYNYSLETIGHVFLGSLEVFHLSDNGVD